MTIRGHIKNDEALLDETVSLRHGRPVRIEVETPDWAFWHGKSVEELAREQGVYAPPAPEALRGVWLEDGSLDDFLVFLGEARC